MKQLAFYLTILPFVAIALALITGHPGVAIKFSSYAFTACVALIIFYEK